MAHDSIPSLGELVRDKLKQRLQKQSELADKVGLQGPSLSNALNGKRAATDEEIVRIADALDLPLDLMLLAASVAGCQARAEKASPERRVHWNRALGAYEQMLDRRFAPPKIEEKPRITGSQITLASFPKIKDGSWQVLVGDRRERPPEGLGDLAALSVSAADFMFFAGLGLPSDTTVLSDKILRVASEDHLEELLGSSNLLLIGSPAVSLASRALLEKTGATMMFNIADAYFNREKQLYERLREEDHFDMEELAKFLDREKNKEEIDDILPHYRKPGFVDPIEFKGIRGVSIPRTRDYGIVALAPNPWSPDHVACLCAGVHAGGTAGALLLLGSPERFEKHPWGGVFTVTVSDQVSWEKRFAYLKPRWETHEYSPKDYIDQIEKLSSGLGAPEYRDVEVSKEKLLQVVEFANHLAGRGGSADD